jgi:hypothetical protein
MDRSLEINDPALNSPRAARVLTRLGVALLEIDSLNDDPVLPRQDAQNLPSLTAILPGDHHHVVAATETERSPLSSGLIFGH